MANGRLSNEEINRRGQGVRERTSWGFGSGMMPWRVLEPDLRV